MADKDELDIPARPERPPPKLRKPPPFFGNFGLSPAPEETKSQPGRSISPAAAGPPDAKADTVDILTGDTAGTVDAGVLVIGPQVSVAGEINACKRLLVEGNVDARLASCETVECPASAPVRQIGRVEEGRISGPS